MPYASSKTLLEFLVFFQIWYIVVLFVIAALLLLLFLFGAITIHRGSNYFDDDDNANKTHYGFIVASAFSKKNTIK